MRITSQMMTDTYLSNLNGNLNRLSKYLEQESTGKEINSISDDVVKTSQSLSARQKISSTERYQDNVSKADSWLTEVEEAVSELNDIIADAYEKAVSASSGTLNEDDLANIAEEIESLRDEVLSAANATYGDSYLFAGYNGTGASDGSLPYVVDASGDLYYNGINMSNEASADDIASASDTASVALNTLTEADDAAQNADTSNYSEIIETVSAAIDAAGDIVSAAEKAVGAATDIAGSADIDLTTASDLTAAASSLQTYSDDLAGAIETAENAVAVAETAADAAEEAYTALEEAEESGDSDAIAEAQAAYDAAVIAADDAAAEAQTASSDLKAAAVTAKEAIDDGDDTTPDDMQTIVGNSTALSEASAALAEQNEDILSVQIASGQAMEISVSGTDLLGRGDENLYVMLDGFYNALTSDADESVISEYVTTLQDAQSRVLSLEAEVGAKMERLDTISARYEASIANYTQMQSDAEDADLAEVITNYSTAETVYNAALAAGAEIIQTSLIDFLD